MKFGLNGLEFQLISIFQREKIQEKLNEKIPRISSSLIRSWSLVTGWWFQIMFYFQPNLGTIPQWRIPQWQDGKDWWWFYLKKNNVHPYPCGRWTHFDEHIFQRGWFNHQLVTYLVIYPDMRKYLHPLKTNISPENGWLENQLLGGSSQLVSS